MTSHALRRTEYTGETRSDGSGAGNVSEARSVRMVLSSPRMHRSPRSPHKEDTHSTLRRTMTGALSSASNRPLQVHLSALSSLFPFHDRCRMLERRGVGRLCSAATAWKLHEGPSSPGQRSPSRPPQCCRHSWCQELARFQLIESRGHRGSEWLPGLDAPHQRPHGAPWELDPSSTDGPVY
jgi:hypothetical protein